MPKMLTNFILSLALASNMLSSANSLPIQAGLASTNKSLVPAANLVILSGQNFQTSLISTSVILPTIKTRTLWVTAYASVPDQTDDTPFITASGKTVRDGIVATNALPFGTRIKIPSLFGDKIFVVEDRMAERMHGVDVWMASNEAALRFGAYHAEIVILGSNEI